MATSADIKAIISTRLQKQGLAGMSPQQNAILDHHIQTACFLITGDEFYTGLIKTEYGQTDSEGIYTIDRSVVPFQAYYGGTPNQPHSWIRLTAIKYDLFSREQEGYDYWRANVGGGRGYSQRYSVVPNEEDPNTTRIQLLDLPSTTTIQVKYHPIMPDVTDFPDYCVPLIVVKAIMLMSADTQANAAGAYFKLLEKEEKALEKITMKQLSRIEKVSGINTNKSRALNKRLRSDSLYDFRVWR